MDADERAIRDLVDAWLDASRRGDVETILSLMTDDAVFMTPGREPFGKTEFANEAAALRGLRLEGTSEIRELKILGDWAYLRNAIAIAITPKDGAPVRRSGHALTILRKDADGEWRVFRDANLVG
jgi:uncharacterized protein (TIGR02246 family)